MILLSEVKNGGKKMINVKNIAIQIMDGYPLAKLKYGKPKQINNTFVIVPICGSYDNETWIDAELHFNFEHYLTVELYIMMNDGVLSYDGILNTFHNSLYTDVLNNGNDLEGYLINISRYAC